MEPFLEKVCPECGGEFQPTIERCADCGVPLVFPQEVAARDARELRREPGLRALRTAPILWVRALAADLDRAEIRYRIDRHLARTEGLLTLLVRRRDHEAAAEVDAARCRLDPPPLLDADEEVEAAATIAPGWEPDTEGSEDDYRVCPECGGEFLPTVGVCPDCDVELVSPGDAFEEEPEADVEEELVPEQLLFVEPPRHELPAGAGLTCLCCSGLRSLQVRSIALDEAGIHHRIDSGPFAAGQDEGCIYVQPADHAAALELITHLGEAPEGVELPEMTHCPACETPLAYGAAECPGCGLVLAGPVAEDSPCPKCGALLNASKEVCPNCGTISAPG